MAVKHGTRKCKWLVFGGVAVLGAALFLFLRSKAPNELSVDYQQQYWKKQAPVLLGKEWKVISVESVAAPVSWSREKGGSGIQVVVTARSITLQHPVVGPYHPGASLYFMPLDWEGACRVAGHDETLDRKGYREGSGRPSPLQVYPAKYRGRAAHYHFFLSSIGDGGLVDWSRVEKELGVRGPGR